MLLSTAVIGVKDHHGKLLPIKALIDGGSQTSLITEECASKLNLKRYSNNVNLIGVAETSVPLNKGLVHCVISPLENTSIVLTTDAIVVPKISSDQPNIPIDSSIRSKLHHLKLADPSFDVSSPIEFLIGADLYFDILQESSNLIKGEPSAIATIFGWVIGGKVINEIPLNDWSSMLICNNTLDAHLTKFWEIESVNNVVRPNPEDEATEESFIKTHRRDTNGRYIVSLPTKPEAPSLPQSSAQRQLVTLEQRLKRNQETYEEYRSFMDDYISQGHMSLCLEPSNYIIPHHCVRKEDSSTTKLRTVCNASFKPSGSSSSLNDILYSGPKLQKDIAEIITNFRLHSIVVCADIKQMYRNVLVTEEHRKLQHIYYRTHRDGPIEEYELNVLTYGVTSSAFLAQRVLLQLVQDEGQKYPLASKAIINQTFVDDICVSVDTINEALTLQQELIDLLNLGGFSLRKWASNCKDVLDTVPLDHREKPLSISSENENYMKVLGLQYNPDDDTFSYIIHLNPLVYTKRSMLSEMSKIYDILGWITPCTFYVKNLMQSIWLLGLGWDDELPTEICNKWETFISTLPELAHLKIPRHIPIVNATNIQIIGFCDASAKGYAANLYLRTEHTDGVNIHLLKAKSKVAPLKIISIPRLELCAAQLLAHFILKIRCCLPTPL
ncbi:uncharacterized protein LOC129003260 [Macrosteles quadrilineatus]|uniref:uncharacterized protein LOC129003260 n=1 Tax=Macrosteles quadrilineatus TaxID=74068 RepID=UPI0023E0D227|nr:uncharacterized protein LOC129003260 [Macrosteles quadrilineatus]